jgi:splicing factor 3B subunit 3
MAPLKLEQRIETHSILRDCAPLRLMGEKRDLLAVASDSGALSILDLDHSQSSSTSTSGGSHHLCSVFGKTGCRRSTPGQYLAADPKGRAVMISAMEKRKLVYVVNQNTTASSSSSTMGAAAAGADTNAKVALASPLEAHRSRTLCLATVGVDNGYDNPLFACLEIQYPEDYEDTVAVAGTTAAAEADIEQPKKQLAYYELDLGLNHVSRKWAINVPNTACCLAALPGTTEGGPSGVLVGMENAVQWYHYTTTTASASSSKQPPNNIPVTCFVPRRVWDTTNTLVTHMTVHKQKKGKFFGLIQTEHGDVFKATMDVSTEGETTNVRSLQLSYFDSLPPSNSLNISKKGLLFAASEFGDHGLYQFERIDVPDAPTSHSTNHPNDATTGSHHHHHDQDPLVLNPSSLTKEQIAHIPTFTPAGRLQNLIRVYAMDNPTPTTGVLVGELAGNEVSPQIYTLAGRGPTSSLRILRHGCSVTELAVSDLPGVPGGIFTIEDLESPTDDDGAAPSPRSKYIVVSFADATLVLSVGDTVEEVGRESGFLTDAPTLACSALKGGGYCQVSPNGVRQIQRGQAKQWACPGFKLIECASANTSQVLIALAGGEVIYFELDPLNGNLKESATRIMKADVCCLDVGVISAKNKARSLLCAVG